jgi:hypothetical protein
MSDATGGVTCKGCGATLPNVEMTLLSPLSLAAYQAASIAEMVQIELICPCGARQTMTHERESASTIEERIEAER